MAVQRVIVAAVADRADPLAAPTPHVSAGFGGRGVLHGGAVLLCGEVFGGVHDAVCRFGFVLRRRGSTSTRLLPIVIPTGQGVVLVHVLLSFGFHEMRDLVSWCPHGHRARQGHAKHSLRQWTAGQRAKQTQCWSGYMRANCALFLAQGTWGWASALACVQKIVGEGWEHLVRRAERW